jgi:hypothetical protein
MRTNVLTAAKMKKKPAADKKPVAVKKKPSVHKKPVADKKLATGQIAGYYHTIAEAIRIFVPGNPRGYFGNFPTKCHAAMFICVPGIEATSGWIAGEVAYGNTCIAGRGSIEQMPGGVFIFQPLTQGNSTEYIKTIDIDGREYVGFVSAEVRSVVPGTLFQARQTDPEIQEEYDSDSEMDSAMADIAHDTVVTQDGDVICTFTITSMDDAKKPIVSVHLMRLMSPHVVAMLERKNLMWDSLPRNNANLKDTIYEMGWAVNGHPGLPGYVDMCLAR